MDTVFAQIVRGEIPADVDTSNYQPRAKAGSEGIVLRLWHPARKRAKFGAPPAKVRIQSRLRQI